MARAAKLLAEIDNAFIIQQRNHDQRPMPTFAETELKLGLILGTGGFGIVKEVVEFNLDPLYDGDDNDNDHGLGQDQSHGNNRDNPQQASNSGTAEVTSSRPLGRRFPTRTANYEITDCPEDASRNDHVHYDIRAARQLMQERCLRRGNARYALKRLHGCLTPAERARGMLDLAAEAKYLSVVWHPNIIKLRGIARGDLVHDGFFIILDRLEQTLDKRFKDWVEQEKKFRGGFLGRGRNKKALHELMINRMTVAYDIAGALMYLHENRLLYRDIKPENIGFDVRGDVKIFDFGLCKSLAPELKATDSYGYNLTGRAGSFPYMAPEVVRMETYDTKCDVFSFAILLWEILSLKQAFTGMTASQFVDKVVLEGKRLPILKEWPPLTRLMLPEAWANDPSVRPDMKRVAILIRGDLNDMTDDDIILHRTAHLRQRSAHSMHLFDDGYYDR